MVVPCPLRLFEYGNGHGKDLDERVSKAVADFCFHAFLQGLPGTKESSI